MKRPACFVAMALGREETDELLRKDIRPVLRALGIRCVVGGEGEDNKDIVEGIIEQIREADLCIADLTYARQSVYFEAGYAARESEVIYTVRKDHLERRGQGDDLRVHFDLEHRRIVPWARPGTEEFRRRLSRRIRTSFLTKWERVAKRDLALEQERRDFGKLSLSSQATKLFAAASNVFSRHGFRPVSQGGKAHPETPIIRGGCFVRHARTTSNVVCCLAIESRPGADLKSLTGPLGLTWVIEGALRNAVESGGVRTCTGSMVVLSASSVRATLVNRLFATWGKGETEGLWVAVRPLAIQAGHARVEVTPVMAVVDKIGSERDARQRVEALIEGLHLA